MIDSVITIGGHLVQRILCDENGSPLSLPTLHPDLYQFRLKLVAIGDDGTTGVVFPNVTELKASIGLVYAEPRSGTFKLKYHADPEVTDDISFTEDGISFQEKLGALAGSIAHGLDKVYQPTPSTWMCRFSIPTPYPIGLEVGGNDLEPETFVRIREFFLAGEYWAEIRLLQGPLASTGEYDHILDDPPVITTIRDGYTQIDELGNEIRVNEVQSVFVPPGFQGTYILKFQGRQTRPLSVNDGATQIGDALNAMYNDNTTRFTTSNPAENTCYIEFVGPFSGQDVDPLQEVLNVDEGRRNLFFQIDLNTAEVEDALRVNPEVDAIFEVKLHITDPNVPGDPGQSLVLFQADVVIGRPLHWEGLIGAAPINWLYPPNPKDYIPLDISQVITGDQSYSAPIGNGTAVDFSIQHMLNTSALSVTLRETAGTLRQLKDEEYDVFFDTTNALSVHINTGPPDVDGLKVMIQATGTTSAFLGHTHNIQQINGLPSLIDEILLRLSNLEAYIPTVTQTPPGGGPTPFGTSDPIIMSVAIPDTWNVVPTNRFNIGDDPGKDASKLPAQGLLLPAVHEAIALGLFTATPDPANLITLDDVPDPALVDGQRIRIDPGAFSLVGGDGLCTFDSTAALVLRDNHGLVDGRKVKFSGQGLPSSIAQNFIYFVLDPGTSSFQISSTLDGGFLPIFDDWDPDEQQFVSVRPEPPGGLLESVDYFAIDPGTSAPVTFQLSATLNGGPGTAVIITDVGYPPYSMVTIPDLDLGTAAHIPPPVLYPGQVFSVRDSIHLSGGRGIRATTVNPGDIIASDGRLWYPVTRSDSPGSNSFYPIKMENEIWRFAVSDKMLAAGTRLTVRFDLSLRMYKHTSNIQYLIVVEWADIPETLVPSPTGPNLQGVFWNKTPIMKQRIIVTELSFVHQFGVQVIRLANGILRTNKKIYGVEVAGDSIPSSANFAIRSRLIEFDTEDNVSNAVGLVYYNLSKATGQIEKISGV